MTPGPFRETDGTAEGNRAAESGRAGQSGRPSESDRTGGSGRAGQTARSPETARTADGKRTVELYVRSLAPRGSQDRQDRIVECLEALEARGAIESFSLHVWGTRIDPNSATARTDAGQFVRRRVAAFTAWADRTGRSTGPFFEVETVESTITDEVRTTMTLPTVTMAEFVDGDVAFVTPCVDSSGGTTDTIEDHLEALAPDEEGDIAAAGATT